MRVLSASECAAPAFKRTWDFYFKPFRWGRSWKWAASAYVGQIGLFFLPLPLPVLLAVLAHAHVRPAIWALLSIASVAFIALGFWIFYLCTRMEIVFFEAALTKAPLVRPIWRRYGPQTWQMVGARLVLSAVLGVFVTMPLVRYLHTMIHMFRTMPKPGMQTDPMAQAAIFRSIFSSEMLLFAGLGIVMLLSSLLSDFMLPTLALEQESLGEAITRMLRLFRTEPLAMLAYVLLKALFGIIGIIVQYILYILTMILSLIPFGIVALIVGGLSWLLLHSVGTLWHIVLILEIIGGYSLFFAWCMYFTFGSLGMVLTFLQYFALFFLGGRYPVLGNLLEPPPPAVVAPQAFEPPEPLAT
jgi:hypothetical protein